MYSCLFVALFSLLSFVSPRPLPPLLAVAPTPDDGCPDYTPSQIATPSFASPTLSLYPDDGSDPTTSSSPVPSTTLTLSPAATHSSSVSPAPLSNLYNGPELTGGVATYFYQNGNAGACGQYNSDSALICAIDQSRYGSSLCGQQVQITNLDNGNTLTVTVADDCPTCDNSNSIDLSVGAFNFLSDDDLGIGEFPIAWSFVY